MSDLKPSESGDQLDRYQEKKPTLNTPEMQEVRNAAGELVEAAKSLNPNRSDGSATPRNNAGLYSQSLIDGQDRSIELFSGDNVIAARCMEATKPLPLGSEVIEQQSKTVEELTNLARVNPVYEPILGLRQHADSLPAGQQKDKFIQLAKEQLEETNRQFTKPEIRNLSQESDLSHHTDLQPKLFNIGSRSYNESDLLAFDKRQNSIVTDATNAKVLRSETEVDSLPMYNLEVERTEQSTFKAGIGYLENYNKPEITEQALFERVAALPLKHQALVLVTGIKAYRQEIDHQKYRIAVGYVTGVGESVVGMFQGADSLGKSVCDVAQFSRDIAEDNPRAQETAAQTGHSFGKLLVGGIRVFDIADNYLGSVGAASYDGDNAKALRDISDLGQRMNQKWQWMSPEEKTKLTTRISMDNLGPIAATGAINKLAKSMDVVGALQDLGKTASAMGGRERDRYSKVIAGMVDQLAPQPLGLTTNGSLMPIPKDRLKTDGKMLMSKADDLEGMPMDRLKPRENREIVESRAIEIAQDKLTRESVDQKLTKYLLDPGHPRKKSSWFEKTLGFTLDNKEQLASQIKFDPRLARPSRSTAWGITYEQPARIVGANGRTLENCRIYWQQNDETGLFEFKNLLLPKKN